jgi:hypothetical protein
MRLLTIAVLLLSSATAVQAAPSPDVTKSDMQPWFVLQASGSDIAGQPIQGEVFIYRGGTVFYERGVASKQATADFRRELAEARFGRAKGRCGAASPDWFEGYGLVAYNPGGGHRTLSFGSDMRDCGAELREGFVALCRFIDSTVGSAAELCGPS